MNTQFEKKKPDLVQLATDIATAKRDFYSQEKYLRTKEKKILKRSINRMIDDYNEVVGKWTISYIY